MPTEHRPLAPSHGPGPLAHWILGSHHEIVLASRSPRRRAILELVGVPLRVAPVDVDESFGADEPPAGAAERVASLKAAAARDAGARGLVLGADTVVVLEGRALGKPRDALDARRMLEMLAGRTHRVITGIALARASGGASWDAIASGSESTEVEFRDLAAREIEEYVATGEPLDKAGAYGIQGFGALVVREIRGDYLNVVGLPLQRLLELARRIAQGEGRA
jgi:septum formation protein